MQQKIQEFLNLEKLFHEHGYKLYLVGGTVRDYLFGLSLIDMDAVTDATPNEMKAFLNKADYTFSRYGSVKYISEKEVKFDITTLREETGYKDARHPSEIKFVKELEKDVIRRDFTINGLYLDKDLKVIDLVDGLKDIQSKTLRMIGDADKRLKEDPLRIIRAFRFIAQFDLSIDNELDTAIKNNVDQLNKINLEKIKRDIKKIDISFKDKIIKLFEEYGIKHLKDVIE